MFEFDDYKMLKGVAEFNPAQTPLIDLLQRVHPDATVEVVEPGGWSYRASGIGRTMHEAAGLIRKLQEELKQPANTVEAPEIQHILSRNQRDTLVTACAYLKLMQEHYPQTFFRMEYVIRDINTMMYGEE